MSWNSTLVLIFQRRMKYLFPGLSNTIKLCPYFMGHIVYPAHFPSQGPETIVLCGLYIYAVMTRQFISSWMLHFSSLTCLRHYRHYSDVIMGAMASQITSLTVVYSIVYSAAEQRKHQSSAPLAFVRGIHRWTVNSPHKWPVTRKMFPFDDVIMLLRPDNT